MQAKTFHPGHSSAVIWRVLLLLALLAAAIGAARQTLIELYTGQALAGVGLAINGAIAALFAIGLLAVLFELGRLAREERALARFLGNLQRDAAQPLAKVGPNSLIAQRYLEAETHYRKHLPINHGALAQILVARESTRLGLPRFIHNILILSGVFGTIVSLSIALVGASDMLGPAAEMGGMNLVVAGMSTALSTTITAIVCYVLFGYAYYQAGGAQTRLIAAIESTTLEVLMPRFHIGQDKINGELHELIVSLRELTAQLQDAQHNAQAVERQIADGLATHDSHMIAMVSTLRQVQSQLGDGAAPRRADTD